MAVNIELKRSAVPGKVPTTGSINLGELAINTYDGKAYFKKDDGVQSIIELVSTSGSILSASYAVSASFATTASSADDFLVRGTLTAQTIVAQTITSSTEFITGSTKFGTQLSNTHQFTGSVTITGSLASANTILSGSFSGSFQGELTGTASFANNAISASYALTASYLEGFIPYQITTGSITASVDVNPDNLFLIKSGSTTYLNISSSGNAELYSSLFIIKSFTTQQPVLTVSQSIVQFATQSSDPTGTAPNGGIWFTSTNMYVGLD